MTSLDIEIDIRDIKNFIQAFKIKYNYDFSDYALSSLKRRFQRLLHKYQVKDLTELYAKTTSNEINFETIVEEITVNTTEMFRDPSLWKKLKETIIPNLINQQKKIKIWHAACSSGEEVYSMAIVLKELGVLTTTELVATDINEEVLMKAKKGVYSKQTLPVNANNYHNYSDLPETSFSQYYKDIDESSFQLDTSLISNVTFKQFNLVDGKSFASFDLILLRNVMIYFNFDLQEKVVELMHAGLNSSGTLILGAKESISWSKSSERFNLIDAEDKIYKKKN